MDKPTYKHNLQNLIGTLPNESGFIKKMRFHQAWWRAFVLGEEQGRWPKSKDPEKRIGSTILGGQDSGKNFLTKNTLAAALHDRERQIVITSEEKQSNLRSLDSPHPPPTEPRDRQFTGEEESSDLNLVVIPIEIVCKA